jgi:hypothetical protein
MVMASAKHGARIHNLQSRVELLDTKYLQIIDSVGTGIVANQQEIIANQDSIKALLRDIQ